MAKYTGLFTPLGLIHHTQESSVIRKSRADQRWPISFDFPFRNGIKNKDSSKAIANTQIKATSFNHRFTITYIDSNTLLQQITYASWWMATIVDVHFAIYPMDSGFVISALDRNHDLIN
ncbi:MAG: hypothetical protein IPP69_07660 [Flavobacteriales bacterium]|nr:hypothetical protein [Flavobacteriales bacterium]